MLLLLLLLLLLALLLLLLLLSLLLLLLLVLLLLFCCCCCCCWRCCCCCCCCRCCCYCCCCCFTRRRHRARPSWARWRRRPSGRHAGKRPSDADALSMRWMCACAGVRAAWVQAWSYGCERARVPAATEAVPNAGDGGGATTTRGQGQLRTDERSGRRIGGRCAAAGIRCWRWRLALAGRARGRSPSTPAAADAWRCQHAGGGDGTSCAARAQYVPGRG